MFNSASSNSICGVFMISPTFAMCMYTLKIHLPGGIGRDGRKKLTGWLYRVSTYHYHLMGRNQSGKESFSRWGGPLPQSWLDQQLLLQKRVLARMHELGRTPVLPAFSGNVPTALRSIFPSAKITRLGNCDTFDENTPPVDDPNYITTLGSAICKAMGSGDDNAIWLMQGWLFSYDPFWRPPQMKALLHSVPIGRLVVLDLFAEVKPIWCMLHNFAGNIEMHGILDSVATGLLNLVSVKIQP